MKQLVLFVPIRFPDIQTRSNLTKKHSREGLTLINGQSRSEGNMTVRSSRITWRPKIDRKRTLIEIKPSIGQIDWGTRTFSKEEGTIDSKMTEIREIRHVSLISRKRKRTLASINNRGTNGSDRRA